MSDLEAPVQHRGDRGAICVSVAAPDVDGVVRAVRPVLNDIDVIEIRLDAMRKPRVEALSAVLPKPLLFTHRPDWEGGAFQGPEEERMRVLLQAVDLGAAYVDIELDTNPELRDRLLHAMERSPTRLIISYHDFDGTPSAERLLEILNWQRESGAHIGKIVTMARDHLDVVRVLNLQCRAAELGFPLSAFCMGAVGRISRVATLFLGGYMTYAALNEEQATAPGQLSVAELRDLLARLNRPADR